MEDTVDGDLAAPEALKTLQFLRLGAWGDAKFLGSLGTAILADVCHPCADVVREGHTLSELPRNRI